MRIDPDDDGRRSPRLTEKLTGSSPGLTAPPTPPEPRMHLSDRLSAPGYGPRRRCAVTVMSAVVVVVISVLVLMTGVFMAGHDRHCPPTEARRRALARWSIGLRPGRRRPPRCCPTGWLVTDTERPQVRAGSRQRRTRSAVSEWWCASTVVSAVRTRGSGAPSSLGGNGLAVSA